MPEIVTIRPTAQPAECFAVHRPDPAFEREFCLEPMAASLPGGAETRPPLLYEAAGGLVLGASHIIASADRRTCVEGMIANPHNPNKYYGAEDPRHFWADAGGIHFAYRESREIESGFFLGAHGNFGHWLFNNICRLALKGADPRSAQVPLVVPETIGAAEIECLEILGYPYESLILARPGELLRVGQLWSSTMGWYFDWKGRGWWSRGNVGFLRRAFGIEGPPAVRPSKRLYISRRTADWRRVVNEYELLQALEPLGFEVIFPERMTIPDQIAMAQAAEVIVSPMGAGSNLCVFAPQSAAMIELRPPTQRMLITGHICRQIGQRFAVFIGDVRASPGQTDLDYDYAVRPGEIAHATEKLLERGLTS